MYPAGKGASFTADVHLNRSHVATVCTYLVVAVRAECLKCSLGAAAAAQFLQMKHLNTLDMCYPQGTVAVRVHTVGSQ